MNKGVHQASQKVIEPLHSLVIRSVIFNLLITLLITSVRDMLSKNGINRDSGSGNDIL